MILATMNKLGSNTRVPSKYWRIVKPLAAGVLAILGGGIVLKECRKPDQTSSAPPAKILEGALYLKGNELGMVMEGVPLTKDGKEVARKECIVRDLSANVAGDTPQAKRAAVLDGAAEKLVKVVYAHLRGKNDLSTQLAVLLPNKAQTDAVIRLVAAELKKLDGNQIPDPKDYLLAKDAEARNEQLNTACVVDPTAEVPPMVFDVKGTDLGNFITVITSNAPGAEPVRMGLIRKATDGITNPGEKKKAEDTARQMVAYVPPSCTCEGEAAPAPTPSAKSAAARPARSAEPAATGSAAAAPAEDAGVPEDAGTPAGSGTPGAGKPVSKKPKREAKISF